MVPKSVIERAFLTGMLPEERRSWSLLLISYTMFVTPLTQARAEAAGKQRRRNKELEQQVRGT